MWGKGENFSLLGTTFVNCADGEESVRYRSQESYGRTALINVNIIKYYVFIYLIRCNYNLLILIYKQFFIIISY